MTRQELAAQRFPYPQYTKNVSGRQKKMDKLKIDEKRSIFMDGLEAWLKEIPLEGIEAQQSPSDAVALLKQVPQQMVDAAEGLTDYDFLQEVNDFLKALKANPSGAAPRREFLNIDTSTGVTMFPDKEDPDNWEDRCRDAEAALKELVDLKTWKERNGKDAIYAARRPAAWAAAQRYLATYFEEYETPKNEK